MATGIYRRIGKRAFDLAIAVPLFILSLPLQVLVAMPIRFSLGTPVLFRQKRPGLNDRPFYVCKLRTMNERRDADGKLLPDEDRLSRLGRFLRSTSLDELPQLWNVINGDMSLIGPRPLLMEYLDRYSQRHRRRHEVRPGITGWSQVNGRRNCLFSERLDLDVWYVDHSCFRLDLKILLLTVVQVLKRGDAGVHQDISEVDDLGLNEGVVFRGNRDTDEESQKAA